MNTPIHRKTHPMVLTAAVAVTIFSILGSAAITGLIPSAHSGRLETNMATETGRNNPEQETSKESGSRDVPTPIQSSAPSHGITRSAEASAPVERPALKTHVSPAIEKSYACKVCGVIESIRVVENEGDGSGLGAVAGGVAGGVLGNQMGKGKGNTLMTILGIGGGAYAGHTIEKNMKSSTSYLVKVRMEDGSYRSVTQHSKPEYAVGDHVRVANGSITSA